MEIGGIGDEAHLSSFQDGGKVKKSINILKVKSGALYTQTFQPLHGLHPELDDPPSLGCLMHSGAHISILRLYPSMPTQLWHAKLSLHIATCPLGGKTASGWDLFLYINGPWLLLLICTAFMLKAAEQSNGKKWEPQEGRNQQHQRNQGRLPCPYSRLYPPSSMVASMVLF